MFPNVPRKHFSALTTLYGLVLIAGALHSAGRATASDIGRRFPSEKTAYMDKITGFPITVLTTNSANDQKIYQTHPQWTADGKYIIFRSNRTASGSTQAFAINEATGEMIQLTDGPGNNASTLNIARKSMKLFFLRGGGRGSAGGNLATNENPETATSPDGRGGQTQIIELDLTKIFADSEAGQMKEASAYERLCATLPPGMRESGGFGLDADEMFAYIGVRGGDVGTHLPPGIEPMGVPQGARMGAGPGGLRSVNLQTGEIKVIVDVPFQMGHVQVNPWVPGEIVYCHETGGDAPQRMWTVKADGTGNRPLYVETPDEWITHEAIITPDEVVFAILGHLDRLQKKPTGLAIINLRNDTMKLVGQAPLERPNRGFWHVNGSADGRWAVGDTFAGNIYLINRKTSEMTLLSTDHKMRPDHAHPTFSPDSKRILIQSGLLSNGASLDLMVIPIPPALLNRE
jgi:oligogalacturonide lyase